MDHGKCGRREVESGSKQLRILVRMTCTGEVLTSATQLTREPLNSRPSSLSMAVFRSAAVSNSTNLDSVLTIGKLSSVTFQASPTLFLVRGQSPSRQRPDQIDVQNLSGPI
jgi:hypothetical protein